MCNMRPPTGEGVRGPSTGSDFSSTGEGRGQNSVFPFRGVFRGLVPDPLLDVKMY